MELRRSDATGSRRRAALLTLSALAVAVGCERDDTVAVDRNKPPETFVTQGPELSEDPDIPTLAYYRSHLFWRGEDDDGTVAGFRWAIDDTSDPGAWSWTTKTDSVFRFVVAEIGAQEHLFLVRAVDNLGKQDATPDTLRFESFTTDTPVIDPLAVRVSANCPTLGSQTLADGDTVEVFCDVTICWDGSDGDGFVVGWETKLDTELEWMPHELDDRCRPVPSLEPGLHVIQIRAIDDAGAKSADPAKIRITSNFDPETVIDRSTLVATLPRTWKNPVDTLTIGPGVAPGDTLPLGATLFVQWESSDVDGPVQAFQPKFGDISVRQLDTLRTQGPVAYGEIDTDTSGVSGPQRLGQTDRVPRGAPFFVKGIDIYQNVEQRPDTLYLRVNFRPRVTFDSALSDPFVAHADGSLYTFPFYGSDLDSDSLNLRYRWRFEKTGTTKFEETDVQTLAPSEWFAFKTNNFSPSDIGTWRLFVWSQDQSGSIRESEADSLTIQVVP